MVLQTLPATAWKSGIIVYAHLYAWYGNQQIHQDLLLINALWLALELLI